MNNTKDYLFQRVVMIIAVFCTVLSTLGVSIQVEDHIWLHAIILLYLSSSLYFFAENNDDFKKSLLLKALDVNMKSQKNKVIVKSIIHIVSTILEIALSIFMALKCEGFDWLSSFFLVFAPVLAVFILFLIVRRLVSTLKYFKEIEEDAGLFENYDETDGSEEK